MSQPAIPNAKGYKIMTFKLLVKITHRINTVDTLNYRESGLQGII